MILSSNEPITHIDLFSGIGGFSHALDQVYENTEHVFVEWDPFCQEVLRKHWPETEIHGDIDKFVADAADARTQKVGQKQEHEVFLLTGGFPCQPFSHAGRRKGTADDRYKWPAMRDAIALFRPRWIIAENVAGLASWNDGLVLETVCADLEAQGYEVQPFVIPAVAVGAPHRRDRIWIVAHSERGGREARRKQECLGGLQTRWTNDAGTSQESDCRNAPDTRYGAAGKKAGATAWPWSGRSGRPLWDAHWPEVATALCRVDDGIPRRMDRNPRLKALGNAIVPQVAEEIMKAIKLSDTK